MVIIFLCYAGESGDFEDVPSSLVGILTEEKSALWGHAVKRDVIEARQSNGD